MNICDLHTHTIASGHGTRDTITDLAKAAAARGLAMLGVTDHGPATPGAAAVSYFRALPDVPRGRFGVRILCGAEVNILEGGELDLPAEVLDRLDYCVASMHHPPRRRKKPGEDAAPVKARNTEDYVKALADPHVRILGHFDRTQFDAELDAVLDACAAHRVLLEINNVSLSDEGWHDEPGISAKDRIRETLLAAKRRRLAVILSSDSHGAAGVGLMPFAEAMAAEVSYPEELIANRNPHLLAYYLAR